MEFSERGRFGLESAVKGSVEELLKAQPSALGFLAAAPHGLLGCFSHLGFPRCGVSGVSAPLCARGVQNPLRS